MAVAIDVIFLKEKNVKQICQHYDNQSLKILSRVGSQIVTAACDPAKTVGWAQYEGFWMVTAPNAKKPHNM